MKKGSAQEHTGHIQNIAVITLLILIVPFIGSRVTEEWNWGLLDYVIMGALLFGIGLVYELTSRKIDNPRHKLVVALTLIVLFLMIWVELATGETA